MTTSRRSLLAGSAAVAAAAAVGTSAAQAHPTPGGTRKPTVVLVHGAFADASGWNAVAARLIRDGYPVIAPAIPLRGVASDAAYLATVLATLGGPLVLAAHSYGGNVITNAATGNTNVKALVYVAAFAPDQRESLQDLQTRYPGSKVDETALDFRPNGVSADAYIKREVFRDVFAGDLPKATTDVMQAGQRPVDVRALGEPSGVPAWKTIPSWYLVARKDNVFPAAAQRFVAQRASARTVEVNASHVAMISQPAATAELIERAAR
ncbi:Tat (twin-arginine translocation) pathway signal sequence [Lentzea waywayandensis]|jgi:pimeloyl-ACP methyl ester carboxylesterase|uniref:Tat (Twin-arginine translocation) pathway signal sequence n=1 Tax=Lentzea waywayandensis TaxID=84724 RepID=A0A1I6FH60_9PSEU|nr:alpha/beta hydrolase [Lentzea waywayandensis]SFR29107.1 Tat (twin-arginine translocation) pathway signal sequence [Lentzea waywayandensis]